jgi:hypothetical protein
MLAEIDDELSDGEGFANAVIHIEAASRMWDVHNSFFKNPGVAAHSAMIRANIGFFTDNELKVLKRIAIILFKSRGDFWSYHLVEILDYLMGKNP